MFIKGRKCSCDEVNMDQETRFAISGYVYQRQVMLHISIAPCLNEDAVAAKKAGGRAS